MSAVQQGESLVTTSNQPQGPLAGLRVIELADRTGQWCGKLMADFGADVIGAPAIGAAMSLAAFALGVGILICSPRMRGLRLSTLQASQPSR